MIDFYDLGYTEYPDPISDTSTFAEDDYAQYCNGFAQAKDDQRRDGY